LPGEFVKGEGVQEAGESPARSRHCNREENPRGHCRRAGGGKAGGTKIRESGDWPFTRKSDRGEDPEKEVFMDRNSLERHISLGEVPLWSWLAIGLLLAMLFVLLSASGELLAPLLGQAPGIFDYAHEFAHDGRHLLSVPCH